ncbi:hypothetical protein [Chryseolinea lacunae]|uniref:Adhesin domain-containing protein n=1 Tax=Chryseolinea lacunae TaxID=2801331 RepID=A0ABS1KY30_9BACT|nr:hypothetical protein [Chryseolinea lacunae]MBL0744363.1 hypothetical protein [Chryseolinea lacunae]
MKNIRILFAALVALFVWSCANENADNALSDTSTSNTTLIDVAETSGQLASGTSFRINGSSTDSTDTHENAHGRRGHPKFRGILDGANLLAPTEELLTIIDAESASDFRGLRISRNGGATITNYDASGNVIALTLPATGGPNGCSFSGHQFPVYDSLLSKIAKTVIDFGSGVTYRRDTVTITRSGKIIITRSGDSANKTEVTTFENYAVNGNTIEGTKTRTSTFDATTGSGKSVTTVTDGKITFSDGTVATWTSDKTRTSTVVLNDNGRPISGEITTEVKTFVTAADGTVIYSHQTTKPLSENLACEGRRSGPVSGTLETHYRTDTVVVDFGDGSCTNRTLTITINGVTTTKTIE